MTNEFQYSHKNLGALQIAIALFHSPPAIAIAQLSQPPVTGQPNSTPNRAFKIEFFSNHTVNVSGYREGETFSDYFTATIARSHSMSVAFVTFFLLSLAAIAKFP
jgi:hypothetical protein